VRVTADMLLFACPGICILACLHTRAQSAQPAHLRDVQPQHMLHIALLVMHVSCSFWHNAKQARSMLVLLLLQAVDC
jgi:hypothetical protein